MECLPPIPTNASKARIHAFAEQVADELSFGPGEPIEPLVARLGGRIAYKNPVFFENRLPESIRVESLHNFTIFVPTLTSAARDRFTIAHELGHFFLHYPVVAQRAPGAMMIATRWVDEGDQDQRRVEWEANWFAAGFLMPEKAFRLTFNKYRNMSTVAPHFGVSAQAAEIRANTLGLG